MFVIKDKCLEMTTNNFESCFPVLSSLKWCFGEASNCVNIQHQNINDIRYHSLEWIYTPLTRQIMFGHCKDTLTLAAIPSMSKCFFILYKYSKCYSILYSELTNIQERSWNKMFCSTLCVEIIVKGEIEK